MAIISFSIDFQSRNDDIKHVRTLVRSLFRSVSLGVSFVLCNIRYITVDPLVLGRVVSVVVILLCDAKRLLSDYGLRNSRLNQLKMVDRKQ